MKIVLFDFDSTLTKLDTLRPVALYFAKLYRKHINLVFLYFALLLRRFRMISDKKMKEVFLIIFLKGRDPMSINLAVKTFLECNLESLLNPHMFEALQRHRNSGDKVFIVSANFDFFLEPLVKFWGINGVICTETEKVEGTFTGKIVGDTCKGKTKIRRIRAMFSHQDIVNMTAYGDRDDNDMLGIVGEAVLIKK